MDRMVCPFHADEDVAGALTGDGSLVTYVCERRDHDPEGTYSWTAKRHSPELAEDEADAARFAEQVRSAEPVQFSELDSRLLNALAATRSEGMKDSAATYGGAGFGRNLVGVLGELAAKAYLERSALLVTAIGDDEEARRTGAGDLKVRIGSATIWSEVSLEVKTCKLRDWNRFGRVLVRQQLERMSCNAIVWCVTGNSPFGEPVYIAGWMPLKDALDSAIDDPGIPASVKIQGGLRSPVELLGWLLSMKATL